MLLLKKLKIKMTKNINVKEKCCFLLKNILKTFTDFEIMSVLR